MEQLIATQTKTNEVISSLINQLTSKFDAIPANQRVMDTQIAPQVSSLSSPQRQLPGQPETNPRGHVNILSTVAEGLQKSPEMVLREIVSVPDSARTDEQKEEEMNKRKRKVGAPLRRSVLHLHFVSISR